MADLVTLYSDRDAALADIASIDRWYADSHGILTDTEARALDADRDEAEMRLAALDDLIAELEANVPDLDLAAQLATITANHPLPWRLVDKTESGKDTDADRDVLDANGQVVTWIDGRSAPAALLVAAVNALPAHLDAADHPFAGAVLEPFAETQQGADDCFPDPDLLLEIVEAFDSALTDRDGALAAARLREIRAYARAFRAATDEDGDDA